MRTPKRITKVRLFWALTVVGSAIGGLNLLQTVTLAQSAPQQAAGAAMAVAWVVIPYCLARAIQALDE